MKRILIIQTAFLGDVILATPVVSELKRLFPDSSIDFLLKKGNESLLSNHADIGKVFILDKSNGKWKSIRGLIKAFRKEQYDLVINLHRFGSSGIIAGRSGGKKRYGFKRNPFSFLFTKSFKHVIGDGTHEVERNLSMIQEFGAASKVRPSLYPSEEDQSFVSEYVKEKYYCMAPSSVWFTKQLPKHKWVELIQSIENDTIYLLGAPSDAELCDEIKSLADSNEVVNLAGKLSLLQSAALMKGATRNYVNDSGPLHLASAMNADVTAFFCSTVPDFGFGPLSDDSEIKQVNGLECRPCGLHGHKECPKGHFKCGSVSIP
ncbi:MAG: glycosyltransferase family 9 protein [Crocinitomicaceae bacterium]|nr:glycosyltransferase family 9 protein [Crocinitomicaceae bacterium]